jgi:hypothetical protein
MAGHLPIGQAGFDQSIKLQFTAESIEGLTDFERRNDILKDIIVQKLPVNEYAMDEEHGKTDKYVLFFYKLNDHQYSYEVHLDKNLNINEVYLVM